MKQKDVLLNPGGVRVGGGVGRAEMDFKDTETEPNCSWWLHIGEWVNLAVGPRGRRHNLPTLKFLSFFLFLFIFFKEACITFVIF